MQQIQNHFLEEQGVGLLVTRGGEELPLVQVGGGVDVRSREADRPPLVRDGAWAVCHYGVAQRADLNRWRLEHEPIGARQTHRPIN